MMKLYRIRHVIEPCTLEELGLAENSIRVMYTERKKVALSTVFLGVDHSFGSGPPILFETMVFGGPCDGQMERHATWEDAVAGHLRWSKKVFGIGGRLP